MPRGYRKVNFGGRPYQTHRMIWFMHYGYFPENEIDHINRDPADNHIENLREVGRACNAKNQKIPCTNTSGVKGVRWSKAADRWVGQIKENQQFHHLGCYADFTEAVLARLTAELCFRAGKHVATARSNPSAF